MCESTLTEKRPFSPPPPHRTPDCGHTCKSDRITLDSNATPALCLNAAPGRDSLFGGLTAMGVKPELVLDSGNSNISDYRLFWANANANVADMVTIGKRFGAAGWNLDLEPQVGNPSSTVADAVLYAAFLAQAKTALNAAGMRLTIAVAQWSTMASQYKTLAPSVDRLLNMETYNANSMAGWLNGVRARVQLGAPHWLCVCLLVSSPPRFG